jgi:hypothetical protein
VLDGGHVSCFEIEPGSAAGFESLEPAWEAEAPAIAGIEPREAATGERGC